ncbi:hypothetical protein VQ042_21775 [Aurantimonas sp. A2-1-M11]|uniref:hypothetical protein n=1 Tax=Aurantimonas sp. A2-1-M11 TaxID=3113712 RepID=UPI002F947D31
MTTAPPISSYSAMKGADEIGDAIAELHHLWGHDPGHFFSTLLNMLSADCGAWCRWMETFRAGLSTSVGRTEWEALLRQEQDEVAQAHCRVREEIIAREESAPPPPE